MHHHAVNAYLSILFGNRDAKIVEKIILKWTTV